MFDNPISLKEICLDTICDNILSVFEMYYETEDRQLIDTSNSDEDNSPDRYTILHKKFRFKDLDLFLFNEISEDLLYKLSEKNLLCDSTLNIFSEKNTRLKNIKIQNAKKITYDGLKILRNHKIVSLECVNLKNIRVNRILGK